MPLRTGKPVNNQRKSAASDETVKTAVIVEGEITNIKITVKPIVKRKSK